MRSAVILAILILSAFSTSQAEAIPMCNTTASRCIYALNWDNSSTSDTCLDKDTSYNCTENGMYTNFALNCLPGYKEMDCEMLRAYTTQEDPSTLSAPENTCGSATGYCGWRDGSNRSPTSGVTSSARAKLHSCSQNGYSDESTYDTLFECQSGNPHTKNLYCADTVWDDLCNLWL